ncbi:hypothetical protein [Galbibacter sp.]|uniref:hypothetical protein n=1 Tax=Galbibacter sp. TaxID=2918471 RepID=UPI003A950232
MEELIAYILQFGNLNEQQIDLIKNKVTVIELRKDGYFSEAGQIPRQVGFVVDGVVRGYYYN